MKIKFTVHKKIYIIFLIITAMCNLYPVTDNPNVNRAEKLIKEKNYRDALGILSVEYTKDFHNQEYILKLIERIQKVKDKMIENTETLMNMYSKNKFDEAAEFLKTFSLTGIYDDETTKIVTKAKELQNIVSIRSGFVELIALAETAITEGRYSDAFNYLNSAVNSYRMESSGVIKDFDDLTAGLNDLNPDNFEVPQIDSVESAVSSVGVYDGYIDSVRRVESKLRDLYRKLSENVNVADQQQLNYSAYQLITRKYIEAAASSVSFRYKKLYDKIMSYAAQKITNDTPSRDDSRDLDAILKVLDNRTFFSRYFYGSIYEGNDIRYGNRSILNAISFIKYESEKQKLSYYAREKEVKLLNNKIGMLITDHKNNLDNSNVVGAATTLGKMTEELAVLKKTIVPLDDVAGNPMFNMVQLANEKQRYDELRRESSDREKSINYEILNFENIKIKINNLVAIGDEKYKTANAQFKNKNYENAKTNYEEAMKTYLEILDMSKSKETTEKVAFIQERLKEIEREVFQIDMENAEEYVKNARKLLYSDDYKNASIEIKKAQMLYVKSSQKNELADNLEQRIETAIQMKKETTLTFDDGAYKNIVEWYENAEKYLLAKDYDKAEALKDRILSEKPFYEKAKKLEIKILLARGDIEFFKQRYREYFTEALNYYNEGNYTRALNAFKQLLEYNYETDKLNSYIRESSLKLGIIKAPVKEVDRGDAVNLIAQAKKAYDNGNYESALALADRALKIWEDVPGAGSIRVSSLRRLRRDLPSLTIDNERLYAKASKAYLEENYRLAIDLCEQILRAEKSEKVNGLLANAKKLLLIQERGL